MEPLTIFSSSVAFIGVFHLLSTAVEKLGKGRNVSTPRATAGRSDWYCFFKMSDLTGRDDSPFENKKQQRSDMRDEEILEQRRRQQVRRPRLHA
jgi:hypothetical protein